jgi:hypothetical protein
MAKVNGAIAFILAGLFELACSGSGVGPGGGEGGAGGMGTALGSGGSGSGGAIASGGVAGTGGVTNAGGSGAGGATGCPLISCLIPTCPGSFMPNPDNPCGCPVCVPGDAGVDVACQPTLCPFLPACPDGAHYVPQACGCAICEPLDAEAPDTDGCAPIMCLIPTCPDGLVPNPDHPCGCPVCAP